MLSYKKLKMFILKNNQVVRKFFVDKSVMNNVYIYYYGTTIISEIA